ncbi:MAG TPA: 4Fe-4S dicluster domain-containing protein [Candidatus Korarchaeota archaeon]|nr:4Fe-4S dicluster domain-containing protein [Candidatus Korarchaeota archaeon]
MVSLAKRVLEISNQDVRKCFQCAECTSSCPNAGIDGFYPHRLVRAVLMDLREEIFRGAYKMCLHCHICSVRCPVGLNFPEIAIALSNVEASERGPDKVERAFISELSRRAFVNPARVALSALGIRALTLTGLRGLRLAGTLVESGSVREEYRREVARIVKG